MRVRPAGFTGEAQQAYALEQYVRSAVGLETGGGVAGRPGGRLGVGDLLVLPPLPRVPGQFVSQQVVLPVPPSSSQSGIFNPTRCPGHDASRGHPTGVSGADRALRASRPRVGPEGVADADDALLMVLRLRAALARLFG
jgi:hypothetical protein